MAINKVTNEGIKTLSVTKDEIVNSNNNKIVYELRRLNRFRIKGQTSSPAVTDDASQNIDVGCIWIDESADDAYICLDNTKGAAVWKQIT